ncbi:MAG: metallophosphoesterase family protein [Chloroflexi bacterium]|nr:metallophosphoesterase family protein [Chloroflexota bacterium]
MRIGLVSDTHIPEAENALPQEVLQAFRGVDLILHAGDIYDPHVLDELEKVAPVLVALGDDDYVRVGKRVKGRHILELEGQTLWLMHISPRLYVTRPWLKPMVLEPAGDKSPDIIISGHEHKALVESSEGILYINPGSPTLLNYKKGLGTVSILELNGGEPHVDILQL